MEKKLKVLNVIDAGGIGGIETLCMNAAGYSRNDNSYIFLWKSGQISEEMISKGYKVEIFNTSIRNYLKDAFRLAKKCKVEEYDVVIFHGINPMVAICTMWIRLISRGTHIISYVHNNPSEWKMRYKLSAYIIFAYAKKVICISEYVLHNVEKAIGYRDKLMRIYNGVDLYKFNYKNKKKRTYDIRLIYVGRLEKVKGVQNILNLLANIRDVPYKFRVVGDGNYRYELERLTANLGLEDNVEFLGSRRDIPELFHDSDVFVHMPEWQEGFGITVIEAMASGKICIVNDHGALPEIVTDGVNGYIISKGRRGFKETICEIYRDLTDEDGLLKIRRLQEQAIMRAKEFSIEKYSNCLDKIIEEMR